MADEHIRTDGLHERLSALINEFSYKYNKSVKRGALVQLWIPYAHEHESACRDDGRVLSTQNAPFAIMGSSDQLALYKYESSKYRPRCDGANAACTISRVYANLQPDLSADVSKGGSKHFNRSAEAQRCDINSDLVLAIYDDATAQREPVAVFELAQQETDVDFTHAVRILQEVAKDHGFLVPSLEAAHSVDSFEAAVDPSPALDTAAAATGSNPGSSATHGDSHDSIVHTALGALGQTLRAFKTPVPPCLAANSRRRACALRRSACLLADVPHHGAANDAAAAIGQQPKQRGRGRTPRPSVIVMNHFKRADEASPGTGSKVRQHGRELSDQQEQEQQQVLSLLQVHRTSEWQTIRSGGPQSSVSSVALPDTPAGQQHLGRPSSGRVSFDGCSSISRLSGKSSSCQIGRSSSNSRCSSFDPGAMAASLRRAATPPPMQPTFSAQPRHEGTWGHGSSRFASSTGSSFSQLQVQPPPQQHLLQQHAVSPFQCGAPPSLPQRSFTPTHHPHRHIVEHARRTASLQLQAVLGGAKAKLREEQEQQQWDHQQQRDQQQEWQQQHWQEVQQHQQSYEHQQDAQQEQQQLQHQYQSQQQLNTYSVPVEVQRVSTPTRQQQEWHDPFAAAASRPPSYEGRHPSWLEDRRPSIEGRSPFLAAGVAESAHSGGSTSSSGQRVRALVAHGGAFKHTGLGGMWEYVGGNSQKLVGLRHSAGFAELQGQLGGQAAAGQCKIKYALPGSSTAGTTTFVDLDTEEDVENMWDEVEEYASTHKGFKLQLYVEAPGANSGGGFGMAGGAYASSDSGRGSGGSNYSSKSGLALAHPHLGSGGLQPATPAETSSGPLPAHLAGFDLATSSNAPCLVSTTAGAVPAAAGTGLAVAAVDAGDSNASLHSQQLAGTTFVPMYSSGGTGNAAGPRLSAVDAVAAGHSPVRAGGVQQNADDDASFVTCLDSATVMDVAAHNFAAGVPVVPQPGSALPPAHAAVRTAAGDDSRYNSSSSAAVGVATAASSSGSSMSSTRSVQAASDSSAAGPAPAGDMMRQKHEQLKKLVADLEGRVEIIMPYDLNIVRFLGGGAFGEVYLSRWHGTDVAVKCLSPSLIASDHSSGTPCADAVAELLQEAAVLSSLHHPNIVSVFGVVVPPAGFLLRATSSDAADSDAGRSGWGAKASSDMTVEELTDELLAEGAGEGSAAARGGSNVSDGAAARQLGSHVPGFGGCRAAMASALSQGHPPPPAIVTEYLMLGSLRSAISNRADWLKGSMTRAKLMLDTARGLDYLHSKRLVHFDLKSANLLVTMRDKVPCVKVADMGLTKQRRQTFVSGVNSLRGTLPWIAPEIVKNPDSVTEKADVFSFGVVMWELWTMQEPFEGVHLHALLHQLATPGGLCLPVPGTPDWTDEECPPEQPGPGWCALMQRCWLPPSERPTSRQLVEALDDMMEQIRLQRRRTSVAAAVRV